MQKRIYIVCILYELSQLKHSRNLPVVLKNKNRGCPFRVTDQQQGQGEYSGDK